MFRFYSIFASAVVFLLLASPVIADDAATITTQTDAAVAGIDGSKPVQGKVVETMNASGYTYLQLETEQGNVWVAIPENKVEVNDDVICNPGMQMSDFESKTLNRTFERIIFSSGLANTAQPAAMMSTPTAGPTDGGSGFESALQAEGGQGPSSGMAGMGGAAAMAQSEGSGGAIVPSTAVSVEKADGENAYTISECFAQAGELDNKKIRIRGKIMKVSRMIMGKNWLHIQDGTGDPMDNSHDLVITTMAEPAVDTVVTVEGTLRANRDFGAGYSYAVIIEDAEIK